MRIRRSLEGDLDVLVQFIRDLAHYERALASAQATPEQLRRSFFGPSPRVYCEIVETDDGVAAGFVVWFLNFSTWTGTHARLQWSVLDWNAPSIDFYASLGAEPQDDWTVYRMSTPALEGLAAWS